VIWEQEYQINQQSKEVERTTLCVCNSTSLYWPRSATPCPVIGWPYQGGTNLCLSCLVGNSLDS